LIYTAADVQNILTAFASEFTVDIPAKHDVDGYWIEHEVLIDTLTQGTKEWYGEIAEHFNLNSEDLSGE
jgi:hypothetical protein